MASQKKIEFIVQTLPACRYVKPLPFRFEQRMGLSLSMRKGVRVADYVRKNVPSG